MKYQININQLVLAETSLDLIDMAILDYLMFYCNSKNPKIEEKRISFNEEKYTWINYESLIEDMPALRIKSKNSLTPRIHRIAEEGFIKIKIGQYSKLYICLTYKVDSTIVKTNLDSKNRQNEREESSKRFLNEAVKNRHHDSSIYDKDTNDKDIRDNKKIISSKERSECLTSLTPCKDDCYWQIGMKYDTLARNVKSVAETLELKLANEPKTKKKYTSFHLTLIQWVKNSLAWNQISYLSETERMEMKYDDPIKVAERKRLHELAQREGVI